MWIFNLVFTVGVGLLLLGWAGARYSTGLAKYRRRLITVGICLMLVDVAAGIVQGVIEGYHEGMQEISAGAAKGGAPR
jgi:hypothetical protein